jgi:nucleotide-binding universal stress UspA family protein
MHVIVATDGSRQSLDAAKKLTSFADPAKITEVTVVAVVRPLAAVAFADDISPVDRKRADTEATTFRAAAQGAVDTVAAELSGWGPKVTKRIRSGSPANEIIKLAEQVEAGLVVVAAGGRGISDVVLVGSTAQKVQHYAPCPVLVVRPARRKRHARS